MRLQPLPHTVAGKVDRGAGYAARAKSMLALAARLKQLSHRYDLAVIVTNQVRVRVRIRVMVMVMVRVRVCRTGTTWR